MYTNVQKCSLVYRWRVAGKDSGGFRLDLGEPWASKLADFCEAHFDASKTTVIRNALDAFIDAELDTDPKGKKRYEATRAKRLSGASED